MIVRLFAVCTTIEAVVKGSRNPFVYRVLRKTFIKTMFIFIGENVSQNVP